MSSIQWRGWEKEAFSQALNEQKPLLLFLTSFGNPASRFMEETTYTREAVADFVNGNFIPLRVNIEERPEVDRRFRQGGPPATVFLTPRGKIITGTTVAGGDEMLEFMEQAVSIFHRSVFGFSSPLQKDDGFFQKTNDFPPVGFEERRVYFIKYKEPFIKEFDELLFKAFDPVYGGFSAFRSGPKFPQRGILNYCLLKYKKSGDAGFKKMLERSLEGMSEGGLFDFLEGGFFRLARRSDWSQPETQKSLLDNISLARLFFDAGTLWRDERFLEISQKTVGFIKSNLYNFDGGGFYASASAGEDYFKIISRTERAVYREERGDLLVDKRIFSDLNGLAIRALGGLPGAEEMVQKSRAKIISLKSPNGLFYHSEKSMESKAPFLFADQVYLAKASTQIHEFWQKVMAVFFDAENGGFYDFCADSLFLGQPIRVLEENIAALEVLEELGYSAEARKSLIEIFWENKKPSLSSAPLAAVLLSR
ncbi:MAG: DUF255 domain-containing protein [Patescibacteria group bacterium]|nr:DUF255 domain-containing protein [Patescibacteria group bacterium]